MSITHLAAAQLAVAIFELIGRDHFGSEAFAAEEFGQQSVIARIGGLEGRAQLDDRDGRLLLLPPNSL